VWSFDLTRKTDTPVTTGGVDFFPVWSPDGLKVAFAKSDGTAERGMRLMTVLATGGESRVLMDVRGPVFPSDWSSDGSLLAYTGYEPLAEVIVVSIHGGTATKVWSYSPAAHSAGGAVFKPSHRHERPRWIAYTSDESGRDEVYLQSLEPDREKVQVSVSGGNRPLWRRDGRELYFVDAREELCAVSVPENGANFGTPRPLFKLLGSQQGVPPYTLDYAPSSDGQRFLIRRVDPNAQGSVINLIR
jgi:Tol biopolymer transport system component